jgi:hypothetical protein
MTKLKFRWPGCSDNVDVRRRAFRIGLSSSELDVSHERRLNPNSLALLIGLVSFDFGLTTVSSRLRI